MIVVANFSCLENSLLSKVAGEVGLERFCRYIEDQVTSADALIGECRAISRILPKTVILNLDTDEAVWTGLLRDLKRHETWRYVPIMGFGFLEDPDTVRKFYAAGGAACIRKPHGYEDLKAVTLTTMRYWLDVSFLPSDVLNIA